MPQLNLENPRRLARWAFHLFFFSLLLFLAFPGLLTTSGSGLGKQAGNRAYEFSCFLPGWVFTRWGSLPSPSLDERS